MLEVLNLVLLGALCFVQNMAFTLSSRSRNSGDPGYHRYAAWCSNGIWFLCHFFVLKQVWTVLTTSNWMLLVYTAVVYTLCTAEGSVLMMKILLKKEKGKRRVGATK